MNVIEINVDAVDGVVTLRGELAERRLIDQVEERVRGVPGVVTVENLLHTRAEEPANKRAAIRASERAAGSTPRTDEAIE
ncbi:MAG TPA: BON domain-containing protein [Actinomycetota bacterium]